MPTSKQIDKQKSLAKVEKEILACSFCTKLGLGKLVPGEGSVTAKIVFVGEAPGKNEIVTGQPFVGRAGMVLDSLLETIKLDRKDIFITSAVKYLPKNYITPKSKDIEHGRIHLNKQLGIIQPKVVVLMGNVAAIAVLNEKFSITEEHGKFIKSDDVNYFLSYHPAAPLYNPKLREVIAKDFKKLKKYL